MKIRKTSDNRFLFYCKGCKMAHAFGDSWEFNNDFETPTVSPSILVRGTIPLTDEEFDKLIRGEKVEPTRFVCHSFIKDGQIQYLSDCTHSLASQTIDLVEEENWYME